MLVSVVIPISGVKYIKRLRACLNSVWKQKYPQDNIEIIITLPMKDEPIRGINKIRDFCTRNNLRLVEYIHHEVAWTPSLSRNIGYRRAAGDAMVSLDADGVLDTRTLDIAVKKIKSSRCAVRSRTSLVPLPPGTKDFFQLGPKSFKKLVDKGRKAPGPGCCIIAPRAAIWKIHGWDEAYVGYGPADWDFVERLEKAGWPVVNISETDDIWNAHQNHERVLGTPLHHKNRAYHEKVKNLSNPVRNVGEWGGLPC